MKVKFTEKSVKRLDGVKIAINYCGAQFLLRGIDPIGYTAGVYGWNCDVYRTYICSGSRIIPVVITTGYRSLIGKHVDYKLLDRFENEARNINYSDYKNYDSMIENIEKLRESFLKEVIEA